MNVIGTRRQYTGRYLQFAYQGYFLGTISQRKKFGAYFEEGVVSMDVQTLFDEYIEFLAKTRSPRTVSMYRPKVEEFVTGSSGISSPQDLFKEENLRKFIFAKFSSRRHSPLNWWTALNKFFLFLRDFKGTIEPAMQFPISRDEARKATKNAKVISFKGGDQVNFLSKEFDIEELLADEIYHVEDGLTAKAIIALILSTGYQFSHIGQLKLKDFYNDEVPNMYYDGSQMMAKRIKLTGRIAEIIHLYLAYRNSFGNLEKNIDKFFVKNSKGSDYAKFLRAFLAEEVSPMFNLDHHLTIEDLRYNMALHSLYRSHGSSLPELIRIFGWKTILHKVLKQYYFSTQQEIAGGFDPFGSNPDDDETNWGEQAVPRKDVLLRRVVRDTKRAVTLKELYNYQCQICSIWNEIGIEGFYAEAHHIQSRGKDNGPDNHSNMIVLCPNHHVLFDYGIIAIDPEDGRTLYHVDSSNPLNGEELRELKHFIGRQYLQYHWDHIFIGNKTRHSQTFAHINTDIHNYII